MALGFRGLSLWALGTLRLGTHLGDINIYVGRGDLTFDRKLRERKGLGTK